MKKIWIIFPTVIVLILALAGLSIFVWGNMEYNQAYFDKIHSTDCSSFECIHEYFIECDNVNEGFACNVIGDNHNKCLVFMQPGGFLTSSDTTQYYCCFPFEYLDSFDIPEPEEEMRDMMTNIKTNRYCQEFGYSDLLFRKISD